MADDEYNRKLESLQQYIPFLNNMIVQLKDPRKKNREQQLAKMVSLHSMITDKKKKLKLETLIKCEDVILKLYDKVKSGSQQPQMLMPRPTAPPPPIISTSASTTMTTDSPFSPITPSSPSPPRDIPKTKPVVIPTEKVVDRSISIGDSQLSQPSTSSYKAKIDIYSSAADSLKSTKSSPTKPNVLDHLGKKAPDMSKPPITIEDLEALQDYDNGVDTETMTLNELTDLREKLQKQLSKSDEGGVNARTINTTVRNTTILTKKAVEKAVVVPEVKPKTVDSKQPVQSKSPSTTTTTTTSTSTNGGKPVKVIKEAASIFGNALSSIDNKLLEDASNKHKDKERRSSTGQRKEGSESGDKHKERRSSKDEKKSESSGGHKSSKDKSEKKSSSSDKSKDTKKEDEKKSSKDKKEKSKDDAKKHHEKNRKEKEKKREEEKCKEKTKEDKSEDTDIPKAEPAKTAETGPIYKRLADKYNPKPRKHNVDGNGEVPKNVSESIENSMKNTTPVSIPFLDNSQSPHPSPPKSQPPLNIPLLSPASSSNNSVDSELTIYNKKQPIPPLMSIVPQSQMAMPPVHSAPLLPTPQVLPQMAPHQNHHPVIPSHVSSILSNPNVTTIINNVVNQFKGGQGSVMLPPSTFLSNHPQPNYGQNNYPQNRDFNSQGDVMMPQGSGGSFWGGAKQPQNLVQNYPQRSFTPAPSQYDGPMPQQQQPPSMDYFPQGGATPNPYGNHQPQQQQQPPALLSPRQFDSYEGRPHPQQHHHHQRPDRTPMEEGLFGNKDRDMRYHRSDPEWRRPPSANQWSQQREPNLREQSRGDPRLLRDPRGYRDDPRSAAGFRREPREFEQRDNRPKFRDPRLNRYPNANRYDRERTPGRSRSVSRDGDETSPSNTFASPLDSLYTSGDGYRKTGKGYGMQHFKIPKIKRDDEGEKDWKAEAESESKMSSEAEAKSPEGKGAEAKVVPESVAPETTESSTTETDEGAKETDESVVASANVSSSTECDAKKSNQNEPEPSKEAEVGEISSSTNDVQTGESRDDAKINDQTEIINKFLKKLLENERTRAAASLFIDNVKNSLDDDKLKMVVETVKSAAVDEEPVEKTKIVKKKKKKLKVVAKKKQQQQVFKRKLRLRRRRTRVSRPIKDGDDDEDDNDDEQADEGDDDEEAEEENAEEKKEKEEKEQKEEKQKEESKEVVVSVGERTKSRKRQAATAAPKKKKAKHKTELDLLHEDIQDMFIRDGVLTATGKRMCRLLKDEADSAANAAPSKPPPPPPTESQKTRRTRATAAEKFDTKSNSEKIKAMSSVRVLIPKIPVDKLAEVDEDGQRYSLRRANKLNKSYAEDDSDDEKQVKEKEVEEKEEERRVVDEDKEEEPEEEEKAVTTSPKRMRKRSKAWASGVLPKRKRKEVSNEEDNDDKVDNEESSDKSFDLVEPDKHYYSSKTMHFKTACKLCEFNGKNITQHYRLKHPDSEVLSSRLSPSKANEAIRESIALKLDESEDHALATTRKYAFKCRFCDSELNTRPSNFYDHVSTHTGEFRHVCVMCPFGAGNVKPLKIHYLKAHGKEQSIKSPWVKTKVYGYICLECNFVQTSRKTVENHVNVYHLGEGKKIMKIYLSSLDYLIKVKGAEKTTVDESSEVSDDEETEIGGEATTVKEQVPIRRRSPVKKKKIVESVPDPLERKDEEDEPLIKKKKVSEEPERTSSEENEEVPSTEKERPAHVPVKKEKEIDMTVFTCNTNIQEENEKIEQERLRKMTELNESVKPNRGSLNFIEELSNRLMQEEKEQQKETAAPEMVLVKSEPMDLEPEPEEPVFEPVPEPVILPPEVTPKKPSKLLEPPASSSAVQVFQKDNIKIQGMIQKLKGILKEEKINVNDGPPPLTPLMDKPKEDTNTVLNAGFLNIVKHPDGWEYACRVPSCLFLSKDRDRFLSHWKEDHTRINQSYKMTKCKICHCEISTWNDKSLLVNFFTHVEDEHLGSSTARRNVLRTRRLSGDKLSTTKDEKPTTKEEVVSPTKQVPAEDKDKEDFDIKLDENPFPFKISGVMSLAEDPIPPLSPIKEKQNSPKIESVVLKEARLTPTEKTVTWKCADATKKFLQCPRELYKCPQFFCKFATNWRNLFDSHIKAHAAVNDELVCCVYCEVKTPLSHAGLHIDLRHSNCLYSCSQCLYRALKREFVMVHMKVKHKESDLIISLPPKTAKTIMMSKQKRFTVKDACPPYKCGFKGCSAEFFFQNDFCSHLERVHQSIMICGSKNKQGQCSFKCCVKAETMVEHFKAHGCFNFHCLICKFGCMELYTMLEHYSLNHPNVEPIVVDRRTGPTGATYSYNDDAFMKTKYVNQDLLDSVNVQQYKIVTADNQPPQSPVVAEPTTTTTTESSSATVPPAPPKNVTLFPLSVLQGGAANGSAGEKKFIAILPKPVDGVSSGVTTTLPSFVFASIAPPPPTEGAKEKGEVEEEEEEVAVPVPVTAPVEDVPKDDEGSRTGEDATAADPLSLDGEGGGGGASAMASGDESDSQDVAENPVLKSFGLIGYQLYRCAFCDISFSNARDFKAHCVHSKQCRDTSNAVKTLKCVHCGRFFKNPHGLLEHIQYHGQLRFCCSLCVKRFPSSFSLKLHMRSKHNVTNTITTPLVPHKNNIERDEFVVRPVPVVEATELLMDGAGSQGAQGSCKTVFSPDELDQLPQRYIFTSDLKCALCPYSTKVRTNLVRHLQFHSSEKSVPEIAPVNPVPCLDKNEKMFDKMTNLAISSFTGTAGRMGGPKQEQKEKEQHVQLPAYVPSHRRYVCCAAGCNYLCLQEANLRHHLYALHVQEPSFACAHCKATLKTDIEGFLKHLKLHDLHLYKCAHCPFVHNLRHKVDKHCTDKHPDRIQRTITIRALEAEIVDGGSAAAEGSPAAMPPPPSSVSIEATSAAPPPSQPPPPPPTGNIKWTKPWHCGMCKYRCAAKNDIVSHIFNKHDMNAQYKCTLCSYKTNEKHTFDAHFKTAHPDSDIDIIHVYYKSEGGAQAAAAAPTSAASAATAVYFDTTPLWQRDRPRIRHIRGILFEESSTPPKETKRKGAKMAAAAAAVPSTSAASNLDLAIEAVAKGIDEATKAIDEALDDVKPAVEAVNKAAEEAEASDDAAAAAAAAATATTGAAVIVIDDDDEDDDGGDEDDAVAAAEESDLLIDIEGKGEGDDRGEVKSEPVAEHGLLSEEMLIGKYGKLGSPQGKTFKCPLCLKFRTKKIAYFIYHVLVELKCHRFKCKSCDYSCVTFDMMVTHCQDEHNRVITANVIDTPVEKMVEYWIQLVIRYQARVMLRNSPVQTGDETSSVSSKSQCEYCQRWFKNIHIVKEHELYHWAEQTYSCGHCCSEHATLNELFQHSFLTHPTYEVSVSTPKGPSVAKVVATLRSPPVAATGSQGGASTAAGAAAGAGAETLYCCVHCSETEKSVELLRKHHNESHHKDEFRYRVVTRMKVEVMYCCTYCHEKGSDEALKKHHQERHVGLKFSIYQYICLECSGTFLNIKDLRAHYSKAHPGKKVFYSCVENKAPGNSKDVYSCTKCPFRSCSVGGIRSHVRKHLRPVDCLLCGATFIYPTEARAHHNKEHLHNSESVEENKERAKEYEEIVQQIISAAKGAAAAAAAAAATAPTPAPVTTTVSRASPPRRMLARKSTGAPFVREYSFYGAKKEPPVDLKTINTSIE